MTYEFEKFPEFKGKMSFQYLGLFLNDHLIMHLPVRCGLPNFIASFLCSISIIRLVGLSVVQDRDICMLRINIGGTWQSEKRYLSLYQNNVNTNIIFPDKEISEPRMI
jgi:hypothetical protein